LFNADDETMSTFDNLERMKPFLPKEGSTVGETTYIPFQDTDEKFLPFDTQGEGVYSNPPNPNMIHADGGIDEESIWNF